MIVHLTTDRSAIGGHDIYFLTQPGRSIILEACLGLHELWLPGSLLKIHAFARRTTDCALEQIWFSFSGFFPSDDASERENPRGLPTSRDVIPPAARYIITDNAQDIRAVARILRMQYGASGDPMPVTGLRSVQDRGRYPCRTHRFVSTGW